MSSILRREERGDVDRITAGRRVVGFAPVTSHFYRVGTVLVDAGPPNRVDDVLNVLETEITDVLLTHAHEDHVGLAAALADQGARVFAPEPTLEVLADPPSLPGYRRQSWGEAKPVDACPLESEVTTPAGTFETVPTPGHSRHHLALHHRERGWLFTGDAYLGTRDNLRFDEDLETELASLRRLREREAGRLLPGHGSIASDPEAALTDALDWYAERAREAHELRAAGGSLTSIRREMFGWEGFMRWFTGGEFSKTNLVRELLRLPSSLTS